MISDGDIEHHGVAPEYQESSLEDIRVRAAERVVSDRDLFMLIALRHEGVNLSGFNLAAAKIPNVWLINAALWRTNLAGADLSGAHIDHMGSGRTAIDHASFEYANLSGSDITGQSISYCNLGHTNFGKARIYNSLFQVCAMAFSTWLEAVYQGPIAFLACNLTNVGLVQLKPASTIYDGPQSDWLNFRRSNLRDAFVKDSNLRHAAFSGSDLGGARFLNCDLRNADFRNTNHKDAVFEGCDTTGAKW